MALKQRRLFSLGGLAWKQGLYRDDRSWRLSLPPHCGSSLGKAAGVTLSCCAFPPDVFSQPDLTDEGLARPVLAGIVATICFLAAAILFSTLAACFVNKQRKRKLKRKKGESIPDVLLPSFLSPPRLSPLVVLWS